MTSHPSLLDVILQGESAMFTVVKIVKLCERGEGCNGVFSVHLTWAVSQH